MKVLVAGSTGNTGSRVTQQLVADGHQPVAMVREGSDRSRLPEGTDLREGDLTDIDESLCEGVDAVIFAAGSGGDTSAEMTDKVDRDGAKALIDNASKHGVEQFVMLSSFGAENPDPESELGHYLQAKHEADEYLKSSQMEYTIIRPVALTDEEGQRHFLIGENVSGDQQAARGDVAALLVRAVNDPKLRGQVLEMASAD